MATIKLQPSGKVVIKDGKVACGCCEPFDPCLSCPPVFGDWTVSGSGGPLSFTYVENYETGPEGADGRICRDEGYVFAIPPDDPCFFTDPYQCEQSEISAIFYRSGTRLATCGWTLEFSAGFELFRTVTLHGPNGESEVVPDWPILSRTIPEPYPPIFIPGDNPTGTFSLSTESFPNPFGIPEDWTIEAPSFSYNYTLTIT